MAINDNVTALGLGTRLADPATILPMTTVIELLPEAVDRLGEQPEDAVRRAVAAQAGVPTGAIAPVGVSIGEHGTALVRFARDSNTARALHVAARRRGTNEAEALHAAVISLP